MHARPLRPADIDTLTKRAAESGFPYPAFDDPLIEAVVVIADDDDLPITACVAKRLVELYMYPPEISVSTTRMFSAIAFLHKAMADTLRQKCYSSAEIYLPPQVSRIFGRRLERSFGWVRNWQSWVKKF